MLYTINSGESMKAMKTKMMVLQIEGGFIYYKYIRSSYIFEKEKLGKCENPISYFFIHRGL